jgi:hypothetical protein
VGAVLHVIDPTAEAEQVHVVAARMGDQDRAWIVGPPDKVAAYRGEILAAVREVTETYPGPLTAYDALIHLAKNDVEDLYVPRIVRYSALAVLQEAHNEKGVRFEGVRVE